MGNATPLPEYIRHHNWVVSLVNNRKRRLDEDHVCALRALAYHLKQNKNDDASLRET